MEKLIDKLSAYNIFTNLVPGVVFCFVADRFYGFGLIQSELVTGMFIYYFVGMIISRISSLVVEPLLILSGFVKYAPYPDYLKAKSIDPEISDLLETNNTYRSALALMLCLGLAGLWKRLIDVYDLLPSQSNAILVIVGIVLFLISFRKQSRYIRRRTEVAIKEE